MEMEYNTALLVIDVQEDYTSQKQRRPFDPEMIFTFIGLVNEVICQEKESGSEVIYIRHEFEGFFGRLVSRLFLNGAGLAGQDGTRLDDRLKKCSDIEFVKSKGDAFSNPGLDKYLKDRRVGSLTIVGLDGIYCVKDTTHGALRRGYGVTLVDKAIMTCNPNKWQKLRENLKGKGVMFK